MKICFEITLETTRNDLLDMEIPRYDHFYVVVVFFVTVSP